MDNAFKPTIFVTFTVDGFHKWSDAPERRAYLRDRHRHLFHVRVETQVEHDDREIEFHDLLDDARANCPGGELGDSSCEMIGQRLGMYLSEKYRRPFRVAVSEDGEVGASVLVSVQDVA